MIPLLAGVAIAYQAVAIIACIFHKTRRYASGWVAPVSILKPVRGLDPSFREAIRSHTVLHGEYEFLCGVASLDDAAVPTLREFPRVQLIECSTRTPNGKVGVLMDLIEHSQHPLVIVNDADIRVVPDYLERVTAPLVDPKVGLVTCLYRAVGETFASRFEGLGIATDFAPSTLVARLGGVDEFALGSTLAFRRSDLEKIGGFASFADFIADDYQLGHRLHGLGLKCVLSDVVVETHLGGGWGHVWRHQVRWARTIRVSKFAGYLGLPVTNATLWAVIALASGNAGWAVAVLAARLVMAIVSGWFVIRDRDVLKLLWLVPARDLYSFAVWIAGLTSRKVVWRGRTLDLSRDGRIVEV